MNYIIMSPYIVIDTKAISHVRIQYINTGYTFIYYNRNSNRRKRLTTCVSLQPYMLNLGSSEIRIINTQCIVGTYMQGRYLVMLMQMKIP